VVLPYPAGAEISVRRASGSALSLSIRRCRKTKLARKGGICNLVCRIFSVTSPPGILSQPQFLGPHRRFGAVANAQLAAQIMDMGLGCARADDQLPGDLAIR